MKTQTISLLIMVMVVLACFVTILFWSSKLPSQEITPPCEISPEITRVVAEKQLEHQKVHLMQKEFRNGIIAPDDPTVFHDLNGRCVAYSYKVIDANDSHYLGYIVISAIKSLPPFLASSAGEFPVDNIEDCRNLAIDKTGSIPNSESLLYLECGFLNYFVKMSFAEGKSLILSLDPVRAIPEKMAVKGQEALDKRIAEGKAECEQRWKAFLPEHF